MKERRTDILAIQETRTDRPERDRRYGVKQTYATHKNSAVYLSSGQILLYNPRFVMTKDVLNSTEHVIAFNLMQDEDHALLKIITIYGQPDKKKTIMNQLIALLNKYLRTEAGIRTVILGDFNLDFLTDN
jgi:exonuclease III